MDLRSLTDDDLDALRRDVLIERERRANLAAIPEQVRALAQTYRDGGGDEQALTEALTPGQAVPDGAAARPSEFPGGWQLA